MVMKRKSKRPTEPRFDTLWAGLMATSAAGVAATTYIVADTGDDGDTAIKDSDQTDAPALPPLLELVPDAPLFAPPAGAATPKLSQIDETETAERPTGDGVAEQEVAWQASLPQEPQDIWLPLASLPVLPNPPKGDDEFADIGPPPLPQTEMGDDEAALNDDDAGAMVMGNRDFDDMSLGFAAPTEAEREAFDNLFGPPTVPQSQFNDLGIFHIGNGISEERLITEIVFDDSILDMAGVTMRPHELFEIRNGNEFWLLAGHNLLLDYPVGQIPINFYSIADPSLYAATVVYLDDGQASQPIDQQPESDPNNPNGDPNGNLNGGQTTSPENQQVNQQAQQQNQYDPNAFADPEDDFGQTQFQYHQDPDII